MASELARLGISMSKEGAKKLGELATAAESSQSGFVESLMWFLDSTPAIAKQVNAFIKEQSRLEDELLSLARTNPAEAKRMLKK